MLRWMGLAAMAAAWALPARAAEDDAAWIERYMQTHASAVRAAPGAVDRSLAFADLPHRIGERLRFRLHSGRERVGVLESADARVARLRVSINGGTFGFKVERAQVARILPE